MPGWRGRVVLGGAMVACIAAWALLKPLAKGPPPAAPTSAKADVRQLVRATENLFALRQVLGGVSPDKKPEALYYITLIDEYCFGVAVRAGLAPGAGPFYFGPEDVNQLAPLARPAKVAISPTLYQDRRNEAAKRLAATAGEHTCAGLLSMPMTYNGVLAGWHAAKASGDPRVLASLSDLELRSRGKTMDVVLRAKGYVDKPGRPPIEGYRQFRVPPDPTPAHRAALIAAFATGDPAVYINLGPTLAEAYENGEYRFGPDEELLLPANKAYLWTLLACEVGYPCGAFESRVLWKACAEQGRCDAAGLEQHLLQEVYKPDEVAQYRRLKPVVLRAFKRGDWSQIRFRGAKPGEGSSIMSMTVFYRKPHDLARW